MIDALVSDGRGGSAPAYSYSHLAIGTMVTTDLSAARKVYEAFFGFECVAYAPGRLMIRDRRSKYLMQQGHRDFFVIDVREVPEVSNPQGNLNHWGISVGSEAEVERIREIACANMEKYRIGKVLPITKIHDAYGFYFYDVDTNWWEVEYRRGKTNDSTFSNGDWNAERTGDEPFIDPPLTIAATPSEVMGDEAFMTHGTTDVVDADKARLFYEQVLKLRSVRQYRPAQITAGGGDFGFVGIQAATRNAVQTPDNRWIILVDSSDAVRDMHRIADAARADHDLREITTPAPDAAGHLSFLIRNADENWFEISDRPRAEIVDLFKGMT